MAMTIVLILVERVRLGCIITGGRARDSRVLVQNETHVTLQMDRGRRIRSGGKDDITAAAGIASAVAVPLDHALGAGWPASLGTVAVLPLAAALLWLPQLRFRTVSAPGLATGARASSVWTRPDVDL